jgi:uncharacterized iron-regulated membrane protein
VSYWRRPQTVFLRRAIFQIHLWTGLATGAYAVFIGLTGAALVFRGDLQTRAYPEFFAQRPPGAPLAQPDVVIASLEHGFPGYRFSGIDYPNQRRGTFLAYLAKGDELRTVFLDPARGRVIGELPHDGWIQQLQELHFNFLAGQRGYVFNGIGASCLLVMCLSGLVIWWPGVSRVGQAFIVHFGRGWKRIVWEVHGATAVWTVALLLIWTISGIYFSFPVPFRNAVERVTTLTPYVSLQSGPPQSTPAPAASELLKRAQARMPGGQVARVGVPSFERGTYSVTLAGERHGDGDSSDEVTMYFDRYTGAELAVIDQRGRTGGDMFLTWLGRLHVGNFGGVPVKLVWFAGGLVFPMLFVTGAVMWWNRKGIRYQDSGNKAGQGIRADSC